MDDNMKPEKEMEVVFLTIGSIIRDRRLELNMTQEDLANAVGAISTTKLGAQAAMPSRAQAEALMK